MREPFRVLALDDSLTIRRLVELATDAMEISLRVAEDGASGVNLAKSFRPHLIFVDYMLPDMKGSDVCAALAADRTTREIPFYVMSAKQEDILGQFSNFPSLAGFIHKPFKPAELRTAIEKHRAQMAGLEQEGPATQAPDSRAAAATPDVSFERKQRAAQAIYGALKDAFARIPHWETERADRSAPSYYAQKLLTPTRLGAIISALDRTIASGSTGTGAVEAAPPRPAPPPAVAPPQPATGSANAEPLLQLIQTRIPRRAAQFSAKIARVKLGDDARRIIATVNGSTSIAGIVERAGVPAPRVPEVIGELMRLELIEFASEALQARPESNRPVMIIDQDIDGVQRPLAELLRNRSHGLDLVSLNAEADVVARVERDRPVLLIMADNAPYLDLASTAREIRGRPGTAEQRLVALIEPCAERDLQDRLNDLRNAGFDQVISKPFVRGALESLLSQAASTAAPCPH